MCGALCQALRDSVSKTGRVLAFWRLASGGQTDIVNNHTAETTAGKEMCMGPWAAPYSGKAEAFLGKQCS